MISTLHEALVHQVDELYDAEKQLEHAISACADKAALPALREEMKYYGASCTDKIAKLQRVYSYLMKEPSIPKNKVIDRLIGNTKEMLKAGHTPEVRDVLLISCIQTINHYKLAGYRAALASARHLDLDNAADLINEILTWERETDHRLNTLSIQEANRIAASKQ
jgi:ferritin-like metal-binding protein YciE